MSEFLKSLEKLSTAEEFLDALKVGYDPDVVKVNRLHILKRFNQYIAEAGLPGSLEGEALSAAYTGALEKAYLDFTKTNGVTEKMFKVFKDAERAKQASFVSIDAVTTRNPG